MNEQTARKLETLDRLLYGMRAVAVAVSGGVDSLTMAAAAHRQLESQAAMFHAVSPAVPAEATERTRSLAARLGWRLSILDAGEFSDPNYLRNPVDRCFFCKANLYASIARLTQSTIVSGTNFDDLSDYRPGLRAAAQFGVRHPYVEAEIDKPAVREIAATLGLDEAAELPASPCLSSRIETGIGVTAQALQLIHGIEQLVTRRLTAVTVRCRIRASGLIIELDPETLREIGSDRCAELRRKIMQLSVAHGYLAMPQFAGYRMGGAFVRTP